MEEIFNSNKIGTIFSVENLVNYAKKGGFEKNTQYIAEEFLIRVQKFIDVYDAEIILDAFNRVLLDSHCNLFDDYDNYFIDIKDIEKIIENVIKIYFVESVIKQENNEGNVIIKGKRI